MTNTLDRLVLERQDLVLLDRYHTQRYGCRKNAEPQNLNFEGGIQDNGLPLAWCGRGGKTFQIVVDTDEAWSGSASARLRYVAPTQGQVDDTLTECRVTQCIDAGAFRGKRVRYSGYLKTFEVRGQAGLWIRADSAIRHIDLAFDNTSEHLITGSRDWTHYQIIVDVPEKATGICFGFLLIDEGTVWCDELSIDILGSIGTGPEPTKGDFRQLPSPVNLDFEGGVRPNGFPRGWRGGGDGYQLLVDGTVVHSGKASGCIRSIAHPGSLEFAALTQGIKPDTFRSKRIRYSGYLKTANVNEWAGLWMRVDGSGRHTSLAFDNMGGRRVRGSTDWAQYEIVLDVPQEATGIYFGFLLVGDGTVWGDDLHFEILSRSNIGGTLPLEIASPVAELRSPDEADTVDPLEVEPFYGRIEEQSEFRDLLTELRTASRKSDATCSPVVIIYGIGGIGKSTLAARLVSIARGENPNAEYKSQFSIVAVDWGKVGELSPLGYNASFEAVVDHLYWECSQTEEINPYFDSFRKLRTRRHLVIEKMGHVVADLAREPRFGREWMDASAKVIGPLARGGKATAGTIFPALGTLLAQGLPAEAEIQSWLRDRLNPGDIELLTQPRYTLASAFAEGLRAAAVRRPLLLFLDTYETVASTGRWLREIMRHSGPRVAWVICGRLEGDQPGWPSELGAFRKELPSRHLRFLKPGTFGTETLGAYLSWAAPARPADQQEVSELHAATGGIPLAVRLAASLWRRGVSTEAITKGIETKEGGPTVVAAMTDRLLVHLRRDESLRPDLELIYGLGLTARPDDPQLIAALWDTERIADGLEALSQRHDFVLVGRFRLHDSVRAFLQRYLLDPIRRYEVREANQRAVALLERRLALHHQRLVSLEQRTGSDEWIADLVALVWHRFWLDDLAGWTTLLAAFPAAIVHNAELGRALLDVARHFAIPTDQVAQSRLRLLEETVGTITSLIYRLDSDAIAELTCPMLRAEVEPDDGCSEERLALMAWFNSQRALKHDDRASALLHLTTAAEQAPASAIQLRSRIVQNLIILSKESCTLRNPEIDAGLLAADLAVRLQPGNSHAHHIRGLALFEAGHLAESLAAYNKALELDPNDLVALVNWSVLARDQGRVMETLNACNHVIELEGSSGTLFSHQGDILWHLGRLEEALRAYEHAIELNPSIALAHVNSGHILNKLGRVSEAVDAYRRAIDSGHPDHASEAAEALDALLHQSGAAEL